MLRIFEIAVGKERNNAIGALQDLTALTSKAINASRIIWEAGRDGLMAYRTYQRLRSSRVPHDEALRTALRFGPRSGPGARATDGEVSVRRPRAAFQDRMRIEELKG